MIKEKPDWGIVFRDTVLVLALTFFIWINFFVKAQGTLKWIFGGALILLGIIFLVIDWFIKRKKK